MSYGWLGIASVPGGEVAEFRWRWFTEGEKVSRGG